MEHLSAGDLISLLAGLITILTVVFKGGEITSNLKNVSNDLKEMKDDFKKHVEEDRQHNEKFLLLLNDKQDKK